MNNIDYFSEVVMAQSEYFGLALKAEIESRPRGYRNILARETGIQAAQITNIINGRAYGSEERRRILATALGWDYEEFLRYGQSLEEKKPYQRPMPTHPAPEAASYYAVAFHKKLMKAGSPGGSIFIPDEMERHQPILLNKRYVNMHVDSAKLAAFQILHTNMEPTIAKGRVVIVDLAQRSPNHGSIYMLGAKSKYTIKRVQTMGNDIYLLNDNPKYCAEILSEPWVDVVVGRVICTWIHSHE